MVDLKTFLYLALQQKINFKMKLSMKTCLKQSHKASLKQSKLTIFKKTMIQIKLYTLSINLVKLLRTSFFSTKRQTINKTFLNMFLFRKRIFNIFMILLSMNSSQKVNLYTSSVILQIACFFCLKEKPITQLSLLAICGINQRMLQSQESILTQTLLKQQGNMILQETMIC
ncbi:hypothetical protein TTHERM_000209449 (macronuclear) [Tetrahymena thermophila SB210]|uniref:Uncharacterized protein n=1 Tax=Tetrahymena thermophila (strain SB210) TaxID=312017 RepID=W7XFM5_TETTS|nr:hypothetical protein TTHERM_000209449 [Tetrahymena thermophila SB210]EWS76667.1 hypothetical protein TTHERM_000209449 [Tetrahymena thermophila SB210]|eukprot:XP_012650835.1 hypothetical protein TTHERM_000209449 [Tetrahymena thermophila SB210]